MVQQAHQEIQKFMTSNPKTAPYRAEEKLSQLWSQQMDLLDKYSDTADTVNNQEASPILIPNLVTIDLINLVLQSWTLSNSEKGGIRAERILRWCESLHDYSNSTNNNTALVNKNYEWMYPIPNYKSYALTIEAWSRAAIYSKSKSHGFECAKRCEDVLMHMQKMHQERLRNPSLYTVSHEVCHDIQPDNNVFHHVLNAWGTIPGKATAMRATRILDLMQELHHYQSINADSSTWQGVQVLNVQPNLTTYKILIQAWANTGTAEGADRAELILRHLLSISKAGNNVGVDVESFHIVMKSHADSVRKRHRMRSSEHHTARERAGQVVALLDWMELLASRRHKTYYCKIRPTRESYRIAMRAWAWSHDVDAPKEAEGILWRMISASQSSENGLGDVVEKILSDVKDPGTNKNGKAGTNCEYHPETRDFNTVINCCAFSRGIGEVTAEIDDDEAVLRLQQSRKEVFAIAENVLDSLMKSEHAQPDSDTFLGMIRACTSLLPDNEDRDVRVIQIFRLAYQTALPPPEKKSCHKPITSYSERLKAASGGGCVNANVLRQLRLALPSTEKYIRVREEFEEYRRMNCE